MLSREPQITSRQNRWIRWVRGLGDPKERQGQGLTVIEGRRLVAEALGAGVTLPLVLYTPDLAEHAEGMPLLEQAAGRGARLICVSPEALEGCAQTVTPQGLVAVAELAERRLAREEMSSPRGGLASPGGVVLALDGVQDPGNVGTIVRAALAADARGVLLGPGTAELTSPKTLRASAGAAFRVRAWRLGNWDVLAELKARGWRVLATGGRGGIPPWEVDLCSGVVVLLGNEARGLSPGLAEMAEARLSIPMPGGAESLNVAMAGTILLYESVRQMGVVPPREPVI